MDLRSLPCGLCNNIAPVRMMKYHRSGEYLICGSCWDSQQSELKNSLSETLRQERDEIRKLEEQPHLKIINYKCHSCGYLFSRKQGFQILNCPYCSKPIAPSRILSAV